MGTGGLPTKPDPSQKYLTRRGQRFFCYPLR
jgi:hypothetical protein